MAYQEPRIVDYGDLMAITAGGVLGNGEDGAQKSIIVKIPDDGAIADLSVQVLP